MKVSTAAKNLDVLFFLVLCMLAGIALTYALDRHLRNDCETHGGRVLEVNGFPRNGWVCYEEPAQP